MVNPLTVDTLVVLLDACKTFDLSPEVINVVHTTTMIEWVEMMLVLCQLLRKMAKKARNAYLRHHHLTMAQVPFRDPLFSSANKELRGRTDLPDDIITQVRIVSSHIAIHELSKALQTLKVLLQQRCSRKTIYHMMVNKLGGNEDVARHIANLSVEEDIDDIFHSDVFQGDSTQEKTKLYDAFIEVHQALYVVVGSMFFISTEYLRMDMDRMPDAIRWEKMENVVLHNYRIYFTPLRLRFIEEPYRPCFFEEHLALIPDWIKKRQNPLIPDVNNYDIQRKLRFPDPQVWYDSDSDGEEW